MSMDAQNATEAEELARTATQRQARKFEREAAAGVVVASEPLPTGVTRQQLRHVRTGTPGRPA
jgi:hypothetical protein